MADGPDRRFYGRRRGRRLRPSRAALIDELLPAVAIGLPEGGGPLDPRGLFARPVEAVWLEVGFGAGEHLAWQAAHHPGVGLIGCEPFVNGLSTLLAAIAEEGLDNVRIYPDDARDLIEALPDASIGRCFVLFPDPWPKRRHHRRRFVQPETVAALARILADGALLRLASDSAELVDWMLGTVRRHPAFRWTARSAADWRQRPPDWPPTRYEAKALHGIPAFLTFVRRPRNLSDR